MEALFWIAVYLSGWYATVKVGLYFTQPESYDYSFVVGGMVLMGLFSWIGFLFALVWSAIFFPERIPFPRRFKVPLRSWSMWLFRYHPN